MKHFFLITLFIFLFSSLTGAETRYVDNMIKITLRTGPGLQYQIISMVNSGTKLNLVETGEQWSKVVLPNTKEGWVLNRFLTDKEPDSIQLARLKEKHKQFADQLPLIIEENKKIKEENRELNDKMIEYEKTNAHLDESYTTLKKDASGYLELKKDYEKKSHMLSEYTKKIKNLEKELMNKYITAGLCGAGILLAGFIIGFSTKRQRRRSSLL
jgi:SH3 domain protein